MTLSGIWVEDDNPYLELTPFKKGPHLIEATKSQYGEGYDEKK